MDDPIAFDGVSSGTLKVSIDAGTFGDYVAAASTYHGNVKTAQGLNIKSSPVQVAITSDDYYSVIVEVLFNQPGSVWVVAEIAPGRSKRHQLTGSNDQRARVEMVTVN